ncbi:MAG TPA: hypothetical protein VGY57_14465, partial [Vicinamibacterales bacterium]|nr:hypothetical protein [Vicinamibacterales bacterium]
YRETFVDGPVYERTPIAAERLFFERHYDRETLSARLFAPEIADVVDLGFWGEGAIRMERLLDRLGPLRLPLSPFEAFFSSALLRRVDPDGDDHPMAAFFTLRRRRTS